MTLIEKMDVLQRFNDEIVEDLSDVEELGHEIENAGELRNNMHAAISRIELVLVRGETDRRSIPDSLERSKPRTAKLPKLKLQSFNGNLLEFPSFSRWRTQGSVFQGFTPLVWEASHKRFQ